MSLTWKNNKEKYALAVQIIDGSREGFSQCDPVDIVACLRANPAAMVEVAEALFGDMARGLKIEDNRLEWRHQYDVAETLALEVEALEAEQDKAHRTNAEFAIEIGRLAERVRVLEAFAKHVRDCADSERSRRMNPGGVGGDIIGEFHGTPVSVLDRLRRDAHHALDDEK